MIRQFHEIVNFEEHAAKLLKALPNLLLVVSHSLNSLFNRIIFLSTIFLSDLDNSLSISDNISTYIRLKLFELIEVAGYLKFLSVSHAFQILLDLSLLDLMFSRRCHVVCASILWSWRHTALLLVVVYLLQIGDG